PPRREVLSRRIGSQDQRVVIDPAGHSQCLRPRVNPRHHDLAVKIHISRLLAKVLRRDREDTVQVLARLKLLPNHPIEARTAQIQHLAFDGLREAASIETQRTVQEDSCARTAFHVAAPRCMSVSRRREGVKESPYKVDTDRAIRSRSERVGVFTYFLELMPLL